MKMGICTFD